MTSTAYNLYSTPPNLQATLGSGDSDTFNFDANTGRMTQYKFTVGSTPQSVVGALTWNANGTPRQLQITDPFNTANAQTCNYSHDDLARIASANCGSAASQTFTYDAFGNINKSGSPNSFQPTYSATTNRMTQLPGPFTPTYDANGNVTNDQAHSYSWDSEGRPVNADGVGLTYDALGRMVEQNRSGIYTQIVYSPGGGKLALMNGQTLSKAFVPLPGGGTAVYNSAGFQYYRHADWLGSSRFASTPTTRAMYSDTAYAPFGETYAAAGTADPSFTGQNQDTVGNLYDFMFREYSTQGRWPSPDPAGLAAVNPSNPQSWNRYAYLFNNPLAIVDPLGLCGQHAIDAAGYDVCGPEGVINRDPYSVASFSSCVQVACIFGGVGNIPGCLESGFGCPGDGVGRGLCGPEDPSCANGGGGSGFSSGWKFPGPPLNFSCGTSPSIGTPSTFPTSSPSTCSLAGILTGPPDPNLAIFDAQDGTLQSPAPAPVGSGRYSDYVGCVVREWIDYFIGDEDKAYVTGVVNIAPVVFARMASKAVAKRSVPVAGALMALWDLHGIYRARGICTQEVYGGRSAIFR